MIMRIGELAKRTGASVQAIRFYERKRLLKKPPRTSSGYRFYSEEYVDMVLLIHRGQQFGFTLSEIRKILVLFAVPDEVTGTTRYQRGEYACLTEILRLGGEKLSDLDHQIESLTRKRHELATALNELKRPKKAEREPMRA
jgi:DNA-binding transcriptional MerR regulator